jgi:hypothetical protein
VILILIPLVYNSNFYSSAVWQFLTTQSDHTKYIFGDKEKQINLNFEYGAVRMALLNKPLYIYGNSVTIEYHQLANPYRTKFF